MDKEIIDKVMFDNFLMSVPTMVVDIKDRKTISAYGSIDVDDLRSAIDTFKKVPEYGELLKQVKKQKEVINKAISILKDNFVYDCVGSCDTTDGVGYYEIDTGHFTYRVYELLKEVSE